MSETLLSSWEDRLAGNQKFQWLLMAVFSVSLLLTTVSSNWKHSLFFTLVAFISVLFSVPKFQQQKVPEYLFVKVVKILILIAIPVFFVWISTGHSTVNTAIEFIRSSGIAKFLGAK